MRVALVIGTRPRIIKSAPIIHAAGDFPEIELSIIHTGQHYDFDMSRVFFNELSIPDPVVNLGVGSGSHSWQTGQMMIGLERTFKDLNPDLVLVPGDTNSTLAGGLAASKMQIPVAHVESGARSFDRRMPEEINRLLVDHLSEILFAVSSNCVMNLSREGIDKAKINLVGDTMFESLLNHLEDIRGIDTSTEHDLRRGSYGVLTLHRAENTDIEGRLKDILETLNSLDMDLIFPCHPRTRARLSQIGFNERLRKNFKVIDPVPYFTMLSLMDRSSLVLTDSGGVQKEAFWLGVPCITLRDSTEWVETIEAGANVLVDADPDRIEIEVKKALIRGSFSVNSSDLTIPHASKSILEKLSSFR